MANKGRPTLPPEKKRVQLNVRLPVKAHKMICDEAESLGIPAASHACNIIMKALAAKVIGDWNG